MSKKIVATRIRVESSGVKTEYFAEYCLEWKPWWGGKVKQEWFDFSISCSYVGVFSSVCFALNIHVLGTEEFAKKCIELFWEYQNKKESERRHNEEKQTAYVDYP